MNFKTFVHRLLIPATLVVAWSAAPAQNPPVAPGYSASKAFKDAAKQMNLEQKLGDTVDMKHMVSLEDGTKVPFGSLVGKKPLVILPMFYTCKTACGLEADSLLKATVEIKDLTVGKDYDVAFLSIRPLETPDIAYAKKQSLMKIYDRQDSAQGWHFLTGSYDDVKAICESLGFHYVYLKDEDRVFHPTGLMILTTDGRITRYFYGTDYPASLLRLSLLDAKRSKIGPKAEPIMLGCVMVDRATGQRTLNVVRTLQVLGIFTVFILFGSIAYMSLSGRRHTHGDGQLGAGGPHSGA